MRHTLRAHILYLENTIRAVRERLSKPRLNVDEVQDLELQLTLAEGALEHYQKAYELELSVSGPEPPHRPEGQSEGGASTAESGQGEKKTDGLAGIARHAGRRARAAVLQAFSACRNRVRADRAGAGA